MASPARRPSPAPLRRRIVLSLIVAAAVAVLVFAFTAPDPKNEEPKPDAVEMVFPQPGDRDLRQAEIVADLAPGYTGYLLIDGVEVPQDDIRFVDALNRVSLEPTEDSDYRVLASGRHCATVVYRRIGEPREQSNSYRWCFSVH
ncbi:MAG TPA: hypothetical protein VHG90_07835 [Acidimicrobiales bacterium]|nr:hypothetical protein [Acidimicrobiales bacterium]